MFAERVQPGAQQHSTAKLLRDKPAVNGQTPLSTIFHEPWWLDIACDGDYREAIVVIDGKTVGRLPYRRRSQFPGLNTLGMPNLVHVLPLRSRPRILNYVRSSNCRSPAS
jgi:hypothetical protein